MAEFPLAASLSCFWYSACWLAVTLTWPAGKLEQNIVNVVRLHLKAFLTGVTDNDDDGLFHSSVTVGSRNPDTHSRWNSATFFKRFFSSLFSECGKHNRKKIDSLH